MDYIATSVFYKNIDGGYRTYDGENFKTVKIYPKNKSFEMIYEETATDEALKTFYTKFVTCSVELSKELNIDNKPFLYHRMNNHIQAIMFVANYLGLTCDEERVTMTEIKWFRSCHNAGLRYSETKNKKQTLDIENAHAYDFRCYYPSLMGHKRFQFRMPSAPGIEKTINELPTGKLPFGFYRVKIVCNDPNIVKCFTFSANDTYTSYSLSYAIGIKKKYFPSMKIDLILEDNNCYIYDDKDIIEGYTRFGKWFLTLLNIREKIPNNFLIKHLMSSLHGHLSRNMEKYCGMDDGDKQEELLNLGYELYDTEIVAKTGDTRLIFRKTTYYNMRLQPFLHSKAMVRLSNVVLDNFDKIDSIKRIMYDSIIYDADPCFKVKTQFFDRDQKNCGKLRMVGLSRPVKL